LPLVSHLILTQRVGAALTGDVLGLVVAVAGAVAAGAPEGVLVPPAAMLTMTVTTIYRLKAAPIAVRILCRRGQLFRGGSGGC
jgi:hypothetical protein